MRMRPPALWIVEELDSKRETAASRSLGSGKGEKGKERMRSGARRLRGTLEARLSRVRF